MSNFSRFMKTNKIVKENTTFPATKSLVDEQGNPLEWVRKGRLHQRKDAGNIG